MDDWFRNDNDYALICLNGHIINLRAIGNKEDNTAYCAKCGQPNVMQCAHCKALIRGHGAIVSYRSLPSSYCHNCGSPYPWTEKALVAVKEWTEVTEELSDSDKEVITSNLIDVMSETARTPVAAIKIKKVLASLGTGAMDMFAKITAGLIVEVAKRQIWPQ